MSGATRQNPIRLELVTAVRRHSSAATGLNGSSVAWQSLLSLVLLGSAILNPAWNSNADGKRPIPGETTVLADLQGPGVVSHLYAHQAGIAKDQPPVPYGSARLPQGNALQQLEVEKSQPDCQAEDGTASLSPEPLWSTDVILFEGRGKGAKLEVRFDVPQDGDDEHYTEVAQASESAIHSIE